MTSILKRLLFTLVVLTSTRPAHADPPRASHDHWRMSTPGYYIRYDYASRTYIETVNCHAAWRFTLVRDETNTLTLYDASRDMTVRLDYGGMWLKPHGAADFSFYQPGTFDTRTQFKHHDAGGAYTGAITKLDGCTWVEWFPGGSSPAFTFRENVTTSDFVELHDGSRDISVRLNLNAMFLKFANNPYGFFKNGTW